MIRWLSFFIIALLLAISLVLAIAGVHRLKRPASKKRETSAPWLQTAPAIISKFQIHFFSFAIPLDLY